MKCKDCSKTDCLYRTQESVECGWECVFFENRDKSHFIELPDEWQGVRIQAAIAAMQGFLSRQTYRADLETLAKDSVKLANISLNLDLKHRKEKRHDNRSTENP